MKIEFEDINNLLAKTNSQIGSLKKYNCRKVIYNYSKILQKRTSEFIELDNKIIKFKEIENEYIT